MTYADSTVFFEIVKPLIGNTDTVKWRTKPFVSQHRNTVEIIIPNRLVEYEDK